jgi:phytoene dehydrogenase-like protein
VHDAVVIGSGPNGLVAANLLADAGWRPLVLEAADEPGGAVRTAEVTAPGFRNDLFSAFYALGEYSPVIRGLDLDRHGLRWRRSSVATAHPSAAGPTALLSTDMDETVASLERFAAGDGDAWRALHAEWRRVQAPLVDALLGPFPPVRAGARLAARLGPDLLDFGRLALVPLRRLVEERFAGEGAALLLAGNLMHTDIAPESAGGMIPTLMLTMLAQDRGWSVPEGGAGSLTAALVRRLEAGGGEVRCGAEVTDVLVRGGRAAAVRTADGIEIDAGRAVLADVSAPALYHRLLGPEHVPSRLLERLSRFHWDHASFKLDWALSEPIPWKDPDVGRAAVVHLGASLDEMTMTSAQLSMGLIPSEPFLLLGQMTTVDPTRSPPGTEAVWAYCHVPSRVRGDAGGDGLEGSWDEGEMERFAARIEERIERLAPGFRDLVLARYLLTPAKLEAANANLVGGAVGGGTSQLHQQLVFRPVPGLGRPETPIKGLYLASASAHPGGGVHGACGANAARAAVWHERFRRVLGRSGPV